ncbi:MAG: DoxX family membrane protein [Gemmatimonadota bacterium]
MKQNALLFLRISIGLLLVVWGLDKIVNPDHAMAVSEGFYFGIMSFPALLPIFGIIEIAVGAAVIAGFMRKYAYPAALLFNGVSMLAVWKHILDPWGWYLGETNALFFPSLIIFAGALVLYAFQDQDVKIIGGRRSPAPLM